MGEVYETGTLRFARAASLDDVFSLLAEHGDDAKILAGGQSLMATLNMRLSEPEVLIDINRIDGLAGIEDTGDAIRIGAMMRHVDVEDSALVATHAPLIAAAMEHIAHPAIRNRGTFGGSIAFADPAAELPACAVALEATMHVAGKGGTRDIAAADFFKGLYETAIDDGDARTPKQRGPWPQGRPAPPVWRRGHEPVPEVDQPRAADP